MGENVLYTIPLVGLIVLIAYFAFLYQKKRASWFKRPTPR